ncbi:MAG: single-stranded-DNA-specific exonuclease RecJ [Planctomyces sp.]|nr:single-stranded-DNA-specific exonuclease RecJ [Planctomyces sp.]
MRLSLTMPPPYAGTHRMVARTHSPAHPVAPGVFDPGAGAGVRGMTCRWVLAGAEHHGAGGGSLVERVLGARGLTGASAAAFLDPRLSQLHDPSLLPDIEPAAQRILAALDAREPVAIYGDYDVDGVTAAAILWRTLAFLRPEAPVHTYIPHRVEEGYGVSSAALGELAERGVRVVVTVDCGITAIEPALRARALGMDLIVTDHHQPPAEASGLPDALACVHPRRPGSAYPFGELSGAGVAYKLAWRLATLAHGSPRLGAQARTLLVDLLALAALGAVADVVPLVGENRVIVRHGLARVADSPFVGLRALTEAARLGGARVSAWDAGFRLAPRLNASGRMAHAAEALELLITLDQARAGAIAQAMEARNQDRRSTERAITERAAEMAAHAGMTTDGSAIVLAHPDWHPGVVGIACSRLVDRFYRPTLLLCQRDDQCHGSGRSIDGFDLHAALDACSRHLISFGGHQMAAGLRLRSDRLADFTAEFLGHAARALPAERLVKPLRIDAAATIPELTTDAVARLMQLEPFGRGNPAPTIVLGGLRVLGPPRPLGPRGDHLALLLGQPGGRGLRCVAWGWGPRIGHLPEGMALDAAVRPRISTYSGRSQVEPELIDARPVGR